MRHEGFLCEICTDFVDYSNPMRAILLDGTTIFICKHCHESVKNAEEMDWLSESGRLNKDVL